MELFDTKKLDAIHAGLALRKETVAVAESVTGGLLQLTLAQVRDASTFYQGGITAYNIGQKYRHLRVEPIHAQFVNCVSQKVSDEMAVNVCRLFNSDWGIGVTGYATPVPESGNEIFAFYTIVYRGQVLKRLKMSSKVGDAFKVQLEYVTDIIDDFTRELKRAP